MSYVQTQSAQPRCREFIPILHICLNYFIAHIDFDVSLFYFNIVSLVLSRKMLDHVKVCGQEDKTETPLEAEDETEGSATSDMVSNFYIHTRVMYTI